MSRSLLILIICLFHTCGLCEPMDFDSTHQIFHFHGEDTSAYIGIFIKHLKDINDDGFDDVALSSQSPKGTYIFLGGNPPDSIPDYFFEYYGHIIDYLDYSGDGISDLVISSNDNIYLFLGHGNYLDSIPYDSMVCPPWSQYYWAEAASFVNGDSVGDILVYAHDPYNGNIKFLYINPFMGDKIPDWNYSIAGFTHNIRDGGFIDFNGDNVLDIFIPMRPSWDSLGYVYLFLGPDYAASPDIIIAPPVGLDTLPEYFALEVSNIGDINGDSWDDLGVKYWEHTLVYLCMPSCDTIYDYLLDGSCQKMSAAGDVNGDGYNDLVLGGSDTFDGRIILYLGGPRFDGKRDDQIDRLDLPPLFLDEVGKKVSAAGDFNGDGFDDILFSCRNFAHGHPGDVFVFSGGNDITVDVQNRDNSIIPEFHKLYQNYPNPFNRSTVMEFELAEKAIISFEIYNILGQKVAKLIENQIFPSGRHQVIWDGCFSDGNQAPSGVYFYRISSDDFTESRGMILLK